MAIQKKSVLGERKTSKGNSATGSKESRGKKVASTFGLVAVKTMSAKKISAKKMAHPRKLTHLKRGLL